jgi:D-alanyl-D-alanine carboxypeptidase
VTGPAAPESAAAVNAASLSTLAWTPFGKPETGWEIYAPRIAARDQTTCAPGSNALRRRPGALAGRARAAEDRVFDPETFKAMLVRWHLARPFVKVNGEGICPGAPPSRQCCPPPSPRKATAARSSSLRPGAMDAYRRMVAEAKAAGVLRARER